VRKSNIFLLSLAGIGALLVLRWCTEPEEPGAKVRPPTLAPVEVTVDDERLNSVKAALARRSKLGAEEVALWRKLDLKLFTEPNNADALYTRASLLLSLNVLEYALSDADKLLAVEQSARAYCLRGRIYRAGFCSDQSLEDFHKAILADPECGDALYRRAVIYLEQGNPGLANSDLLKCQHAKFLQPVIPGHVNACVESTLYFLGRAREGMNDKEGAVSAYRQYIAFIDKQKFDQPFYDDSYDQKRHAEERIEYIIPDSLER
jgi:tetratricopeptide (TPR) repeat protein